MSRIPRSHSRFLSVDGVAYRWLVKDGRWRYGGSGVTLRLVVQAESACPGDPLIAVLFSKNWNQGNAEEWDFTHRAALGPCDVAAVVRKALEEGWLPEAATGRAFFPAGPLELAEYRLPAGQSP